MTAEVTPQNILKGIKLLSVPIGYEVPSEFTCSHKDWLVARIEQLETALVVYCMTNETFPEYGDVAREVLSTHPMEENEK